MGTNPHPPNQRFAVRTLSSFTKSVRIQIHTPIVQVMLSKHPATADILLLNLKHSNRTWPVTLTRTHQH